MKELAPLCPEGAPTREPRTSTKARSAVIGAGLFYLSFPNQLQGYTWATPKYAETEQILEEIL